MIKDFRGNEYTSVSEMCSKYGIKKDVYMERMASGTYTQEQALTETSVNAKRTAIFGPMADRMLEVRFKDVIGEDGTTGMKQSEFAKFLARISGYGDCLTLMMVSSVENARRAYDMDVYISLAQYLNVSVDYLFGRCESREAYKPAKGYRGYYESISSITDNIEGLNLKNRGTEAKLKVAQALNVPLDYLLGLTDEKKLHK